MLWKSNFNNTVMLELYSHVTYGVTMFYNYTLCIILLFSILLICIIIYQELLVLPVYHCRMLAHYCTHKIYNHIIIFTKNVS